MKKACSVCLINCLRLHGGEEEDEDANPCLHCSLWKPIEVGITRSRHRQKGVESVAKKEVGNVAKKEVGNVVETVQADRHPSFLKKITESTMSILKLPLSFVADHTERLGERVVLEGPGKEQWRVELHRSCGSVNTSFGQGWEQFVVDHVLQIGDQLSFSLSENSYFQVEVQIFYRNVNLTSFYVPAKVVLGLGAFKFQFIFCHLALINSVHGGSFRFTMDLVSRKGVLLMQPTLLAIRKT